MRPKKIKEPIEMPCWEPAIKEMPGYNVCDHYGQFTQKCWLDEGHCPSAGKKILK